MLEDKEKQEKQADRCASTPVAVFLNTGMKIEARQYVVF
jgi:hypothetical protein